MGRVSGGTAREFCMRRALVWMCVGIAAGGAWAANLTVDVGETAVVGAGQSFGVATVRNGGVLVMEGGAITNDFGSVTNEAGGRLIFNSGYIHDFVNYGLAELYGGTQSLVSSENRGYLKLAGGDPGIQIVHFGSMLDVYSYATNRTAWEISSDTTNGAPGIRIFCLSSSLPVNTYTWNTLPTHAGFPGGRVCRTTNRFWVSGVVWTGIIDISVRTNWGGSVKIVTYVPPTTVTSGVRPAVEVTWNAVAGRTYQVQKSTDLIGGVWTSVGLPYVAQSALGSVCDSAGNTGTSYRVLIRH